MGRALKACPERSEGRRLGEYASPEGLIASFRACPERSEGTRAIAARSGARGDCRAARARRPAALLQEAEAELADLDGRLQEAQSGRARAEARCRELTSEVERLSAAGEALEALESLVRRSR